MIRPPTCPGNRNRYKHTHRVGDVLKLGYGDGLFTQELVHMGHRVTLLEGAQSLVEKVRAEYGDRVQVHHRLFEEFETEGTYDYIIATHVLEHLDDPVSVLRRMKPWLRPSGRLVVIVPNKESLHRQIAVLMNLQPEMDTLGDRDKKGRPSEGLFLRHVGEGSRRPSRI